jgi:hypothetical protein
MSQPRLIKGGGGGGGTQQHSGSSSSSSLSTNFEANAFSTPHSESKGERMVQDENPHISSEKRKHV